MRADYFGCWGGPGHYLWTPDGNTARAAGPWTARNLDASSYARPDFYSTVALSTGRGFAPVDGEERQGVWRLTRAPGWTAISAYDRTCDGRKGSISVFVAEGEHDTETMKAIAAEHFPAVWARITGARS